MTGIRIVLIEDHDLTRIGLQTALQQDSDVQVIGEAATGLEGLRLIQTLHPDVAIVDIGLPDISGIELTQRFRQSSANLEAAEATRTRILILTMQDNENAVLASFAAGADSYCMKNVSSARLLEAVQMTKEGNNWIDPSIARLVLTQVQQTQHKKMTSSQSHEAEKVSIEGIDPDHEKLLAADPLTERELEVLQLIVKGCSNIAIAEKLYITVGTVKTHVRNILNKLSADDRTQAAVLALRAGLVT
jgi:two-component system, NarL family, response regulator LiaR